MINKNLIMDVGAHMGRDTQYYLGLGYNVVAVEANPECVWSLRDDFNVEINDERLRVIHTAISTYKGTIDLITNNKNSALSTVYPERAERNKLWGAVNSTVLVPCNTFENILRSWGIPYYLKIDIEGADHLCLEALEKFKDRPSYVSTEVDFDNYKSALATLHRLGYDKFKTVNQGSLPENTSGPFGEDAPGEWKTFEQTKRLWWFLGLERRLFEGASRLHGTKIHKWYQWLKGATSGPYDIHARHHDKVD